MASTTWFNVYNQGGANGQGNIVSLDNVGTALSFGSVADTTKAYLAPNEIGVGTADTTEHDYHKWTAPRAGILKNLYISADVAPGSAKTLVVTVRTGSGGIAATMADSILTATISGATATTASDTTDQVLVNAGDVVTISHVLTSGGSSSYVGGGLQFVPIPA